MSTPAMKVSTAHLDRLAYVYVRQSTGYQVIHHRESTERQYKLRELQNFFPLDDEYKTPVPEPQIASQ